MQYVGFPGFMSKPIDQIPDTDNMIVTSPDLEEGLYLPIRCTAYGEDVSPELDIDRLPDGTKTLAVTMEEVREKKKKNYSHWVIWNLPAGNVIEGNIPPGIVNEKTGAVQGMAHGEHCYKGPRHTLVPAERTYLFTVYALDTALDIYVDTMREDLLRWMNGHVLGRGTLSCTFKSPHVHPHSLLESGEKAAPEEEKK